MPKSLVLLIGLGACLLMQPLAAAADEHSVRATVKVDSNPPAVSVAIDSPDAVKDDTHAIQGNGREIVNVGGDSHLPAGEQADAVVSVFGNATSDGDVSDSVVAVFGDARANANVGDSVVAVVGDNTINGSVGDTAVTVLGNLTLGPNARVGGDAVVVGGTVQRDPEAKVTGQVVNVMSGLHNAGPGLKLWFQKCLAYGRPLAFLPGLAWAWVLAAVALALYLLIAMLAGNALRRCCETVEQRPGLVLISAVLAWVLVPAAWLLLLITVIGIVATPFFGLALMCAHIFGRAIILAWLGRQLLGIGGSAARQQMVPAVLIGGVLVALLYCVPVLGFILFTLVGWLGFGAVLATLYLALKRRNAEKAAQRAAARTAATANAAAATGAQDAENFADAGEGTAGAGTVGAGVGTVGGNSAEAAVDANTGQRATLGTRLLALGIDLVLVGVLVGSLPWVDASMRLFLLCAALYGALFWKLKGATIGGVLLRTRVVRLDGRPLDWPTVVVRGLSCIVSALPLGLGFFWVGFDADRQAWHDKLAGTVVIRTREPTSLV